MRNHDHQRIRATSLALSVTRSVLIRLTTFDDLAGQFLGDIAMRFTNLKKHSIAALGLAAIFVGATVAEAGLTGGARLRPGKGFQNRNSPATQSYSRSWQQNYTAPRTVGSTPVYQSTPKVVTQPQRVLPRTSYRPSWFSGFRR